MAKIPYIDYKPQRKTVELIGKCNEILEDYAAQGFDMTLRQLYYQLVAQDIIPNNFKTYKSLGGIITKARLGGLVDWDHIVDRTRNVRSLIHWEDPAEIIASTADRFQINRWANQDYQPEVWIEKDALAGVFQDVCDEYDVPLFSCRGYASISEMHEAATYRLARYWNNGQHPLILHFGDHDPSGLDMTRDIIDRLYLFAGDIPVTRVALNIGQINEHNPPPNFAKESDTRWRDYADQFGNDSWELDALNPQILSNLVRDEIENLKDPEKWEEIEEIEKSGQDQLLQISENFERIQGYLLNGNRND